MQPKPQASAEYEYLAESIDTSKVSAPSHANVRLDGFFPVDYTTAYFAAWQHLQERANELAIPITYLQRHNLELVLKDLRRGLLRSEEKVMLAHEIFGAPISPELEQEPHYDGDWELAHSCHKFAKLFSAVAKHLGILGLPALPDDFHKARELMEAVENGDATRLRYDTVRQPAGIRVSSFAYEPWKESPKVVPMAALSELLTKIMTEHCRVSESDTGAPSFSQSIATRGEEAWYGVADCLQILERATRAGEVTWSRTRYPMLNLNTHRDFSGCDELVRSLCAEYLVADYRERRLALIVLVGAAKTYGAGKASCEDAHLLAGQSPTGTLTRLADPLEYQSNLVNAVFESVRRREQAPVSMP